MSNILAVSMEHHVSRMAHTRLKEDDFVVLENLPCLGHIEVSQAYIENEFKNNKRPYMTIVGSVSSIDGNFGVGLNGVKFSKFDKPYVKYTYNFTDDELSVLAKKGLFHSDFKCPSIITNAKNLELPMSITCHAINTETAPIICINIENAFELEASIETSGYPMTDYFEQWHETPEERKFDEFEDDIDSIDTSIFGEHTKEQTVEEEYETPITLTPEEIKEQIALKNMLRAVEASVLQKQIDQKNKIKDLGKANAQKQTELQSSEPTIEPVAEKSLLNSSEFIDEEPVPVSSEELTENTPADDIDAFEDAMEKEVEAEDETPVQDEVIDETVNDDFDEIDEFDNDTMDDNITDDESNEIDELEDDVSTSEIDEIDDDIETDDFDELDDESNDDALDPESDEIVDDEESEEGAITVPDRSGLDYTAAVEKQKKSMTRQNQEEYD